jgi:carboxyl-terminal processing protease
MFVRSYIWFFLFLANILFSNVGNAQPTQSISKEEKIFGFSYFWREVSYNFAHWQVVPQLDWDKAYQEYLPRILASQNDLEYYLEMQRFCALLKDGHTNVYLSPDMLENEFGRLPLELLEIHHQAIVANVEQQFASQIPIGSEILSINGRSVKDVVEKDIIPLISTSAPHMYWDTAIRSPKYSNQGILTGPRDNSSQLDFKTPNGEVKQITLTYMPLDYVVSWLREPETRPLYEFTKLDNGIVYMALNYFSKPEIVTAFEDKLPEFYQAKGIILDLRKNGGGSSANASAILEYFTDKPFYKAAWKTPKHIAAYKAWGSVTEEYRNYFSGHEFLTEEADVINPKIGKKLLVPTKVLIGHKTASAAEDFLVMADSIEHISYVGEATYGSTGQPLRFDLPGGGKARVSTKRDSFADGREFTGKGIIPDVIVEKSINDIIEGRDPVLEKALSLFEH